MFHGPPASNHMQRGGGAPYNSNVGYSVTTSLNQRVKSLGGIGALQANNNNNN